MNELTLHKTHIVAKDGTPTHLVYDQEGDILEIFFGDNIPATGIELTDHIVLRVDQESQRAVSLLLLDFSILTEQTLYGPRSFPLDKLDETSADLRELALQLITSLPVSQFLKISHFQLSAVKQIPSAFVEAQFALAPV
jgi:hypothetical protein